MTVVTAIPSIPTSMRDDEVERLQALATGAVVLEVGSWLGHSTVAMAGTAEVVYAVDWHRGDPQAGPERTALEFLSNLRAYGVEDRVVPIVGRAEVVLPHLLPGLAQLGFHDAYHGAAEVRRDLRLMAPLVDGLIAVHDYGDERFGVTEAVDRLIADDGWEQYDLTWSLIVLRAPR